MCGVVGIFSNNSNPVPGDDVIRKMADSIIHRGPDDEGIYSNADVALGFRRLSIIDLDSGHQPIHNEDKSIWTVLNGEIYNYKELRSSLIQKGHTFYTNADTEVLVHLYEEFGEELVHQLRGMFVFCIWDSRKKKLLIFRDHLGIKPLFYTEANGQLIFASEMKAIIASGFTNKKIDVNALDHYLGLQYVPAPLTIYEDIKKLPPGHMISISKGQSAEVSQYWDSSIIPVTNMSLSDCMERYEELFTESVKLQMRSDVPLGAFLSGGVDSSAVVAVMSELSDSPINTFTICHTDQAYDESKYAAIVSEKYGTNHRTLTIGPNDFLELLPSVIDQYDEPFADSSALPTHLVSKLAGQHVKVVLSGDGGDETCGGYSRYSNVMHFHNMDKRLNLKRFLPSSLKQILANKINFSHGLSNKGLKYLVNMLSSDVERDYFYMSYFRAQKRKLYGQALIDRVNPGNDILLLTKYLQKNSEDDLLRKLLNLDINTYLADDILYKVDIASMGNSLEVRVPLLDHKLVEFAASIPSKYKLKDRNGKMFFKKLLEKRLPHDILYRKKKGFEIPISAWFRGELAVYIKDLLLSSTLLREPYFDRVFIEHMLSQHQSGREDFGPHLWILMSLELWHRKSGGTFSGC
jgi:asparagine synthase (glutamine-hydrolysing)